MLHFNTDKVFEAGTFPALVYSAKQEYGQQRHDRPMHRHSGVCELLLCYRGFGTYHCNHETYPLQQGDLIYGNVEELHEVISDYDVEIGTYCFGICNLHFRGLPPNHIIPANSAHVRPCGHLFPFFQTLCEQINDLCGGDAHDTLTAEMMLGTLVLMANRLPDDGRAVSQHRDGFVERVKDYIDAHYTEPITLGDIAQALNCSETYVTHTFKNATGYSPFQFIIRRRIGLAQTLLISSDLSATQIAAMVGYDNSNYFNTLFTRVAGISPIRYRVQYLELLRGRRDQS